MTAGEGYHEAPEYGITEIVDGQVVATGFLNYAMPFVRYETGDRATVNESGGRCACGRGLPLAFRDFDGRQDDILVKPGGGYLPGVNFYTMMYRVPGVAMFQIVQREPDAVTVKVVPGAGFDTDSALAIQRGMQERLGAAVRVTLDLVDAIERSTATGKIRTVQCECKEARG